MSAATPSPMLDRLTKLVSRVIQESTGRKVDPKPDAPLIASGILDSLSMVNLVIALQGEFAVELDTSDLNEQSFGSVRAIHDLLQSRGAR